MPNSPTPKYPSIIPVTWNPGYPLGLQLYKPCRYVSATPKEGLLRRFGLKTGIDFAHFGLESGSGSWGNYGTVWTYFSCNEKYANSKWILRNFFVAVVI